MATEKTPRRLSQWEIDAHLPLIKGWRHEGPRLVREFKFKDFGTAIKFTGRLAGPAKRHGHMADLDVRSGNVSVALTTHDVGGITEKDVELAKSINKLKV